MLLKSSSTPLLGSLLPPDHHHDAAAAGKHSPFTFHCNTNALSFSSLNSSASLHSSPSFSDHHRPPAAFRRTHSDGNLNTLSRASDATDVREDPSFNFKRPTRSLLQTIPSFSFYGSRARTEEEEDDDDDGDQRTHLEEDEGEYSCIDNRMELEAAIVTPEVGAMEQAWNRVGSGGDSQKEMYLATGLGIGGTGGGGGGRRSGGGGGGEQHGMEEYYRKMVVENPGNALVLSNYAEFLYQWKGDLRGAEEYYSRAILMDSEDGGVLSKYAKLVWELHHDQQTASSYFQHALQASPHDSHVQAAYANFLWETEEDENEDSLVKEMAAQTYTTAATA